MILESNDEFDQLAEFDLGTATIQFWSRKQHPELAESIVGCFSRINATIVSLYRIGGVLYLRIGDREFELTDDVSSELESKGKNREFRLRRGQDILVTHMYLAPEPEIPRNIDPTPGVEEEHIDFLLFVHNVLTEPGRRYRVWNQSKIFKSETEN